MRRVLPWVDLDVIRKELVDICTEWLSADVHRARHSAIRRYLDGESPILPDIYELRASLRLILQKYRPADDPLEEAGNAIMFLYFFCDSVWDY